MHRFQQTLDELKSNLCDIEAERVSLDEQEETIKVAIDGLERLIALEISGPVNNSSRPASRPRQPRTQPPSSRNSTLRNCRLCKTTCDRDHLLNHALEMFQRGVKQADIAKALGVSSYTVTGWKGQLGLRKTQLKSETVISVLEVLIAETPPLRAEDLVTDRERQVRDASQSLKEFKQRVRRPVLSEKPNDCGKCVSRTIDGVTRLAASPDCAIHGLGLGEAKEGRDRKGDPMYLKGSSV